MAGDSKLPNVIPLPGKRLNFKPAEIPDPTYLDDWPSLEQFCTREETRTVLRYLAPKLREERLLTVLDGLTLVAVCEDYADLWIARQQKAAIDKAGAIAAIKSKRGAIKAHPVVQQIAEAASRFDRGILHLGLSPAARAKMKVPNGQGDLFGHDPLAELMSQIHGSGRGLPANSAA
jgi:P27 family predicted phage terminase small subunit